MNVETTIEKSVDGISQLSTLGINGFVLFVLAMAMGLFLFMGFIAYKALQQVMQNHRQNQKDINMAHDRNRELEDRVSKLEKREEDCLEKLEESTEKLKEYVDELRRERENR